MKHILAILAAVALMPQLANAQIDQCPWCRVPTNPAQATGTVPSGSANFKYPPEAPAFKPSSLPPVEYDHAYSGQMIVTKWNDYDLVRLMCKDTPGAIACSYRVYDPGNPSISNSCLIMLGPAVHNDERTLRHEIGHCNGWSDKHEGAR